MAGWGRGMGRRSTRGWPFSFVRLIPTRARMLSKFTAMAVNFDNILARVGMRRTKENGQPLVDRRPIPRPHPAIPHLLRPVALRPVMGFEQLAQNRQGLGAAQAHDADAA